MSCAICLATEASGVCGESETPPLPLPGLPLVRAHNEKLYQACEFSFPRPPTFLFPSLPDAYPHFNFLKRRFCNFPHS